MQETLTVIRLGIRGKLRRTLGMREAEQQSRKVTGYTDLPRLAIAIERRLHVPQPNPATQEAATAVTM
jgi:hypothetical protein